MKRPGPAPAIFLLMVLAIAYFATRCQPQPAYCASEPALKPVLFISTIQNYFAAPLTSSCTSEDNCK